MVIILFKNYFDPPHPGKSECKLFSNRGQSSEGVERPK